MALKDQSRLIKQYAFVSVANYSIVGTGETIPLALRDYQQGLKNSGIAGVAPPASEQAVVTGTVERIASEVSGGDTVYKMILAEHPDKIFTVPALVSDELALTREGTASRSNTPRAMGSSARPPYSTTSHTPRNKQQGSRETAGPILFPAGRFGRNRFFRPVFVDRTGLPHYNGRNPGDVLEYRFKL